MADIKTILVIIVSTYVLSIAECGVVQGTDERETKSIEAKECILSPAGSEYVGRLAVTVSGKTCQAWSSHSPHEHTYNQGYMFPDGSVTAASNFCRNPKNEYDGLWCYTTDPKTRYERCAVPTCGMTDCTLTTSGREYVGYKHVTVSGTECQPWSSQTPHAHGFVGDNMFPDGSVKAASNFCRNPENGFVGLWCYTTNPAKRWEKCDVPTCACKSEQTGRTYRGVIRSTVSGLLCQHWSSQSPHTHRFTNDDLYADGSVKLADNFCRNPDDGFTDGAWCYTTDAETRWELCDVPLCAAASSAL